MTDKAKILEATKKSISSLLVSGGATEILGRTLSANQVEKDYREMIDKNGIPVRAMGFTSIEEFYRAIPDTVGMKYEGNQLHLQGISNDKTDHISRMISRQKNKPKVSDPTRRMQRGRGGRARASFRPLYGGPRRSPMQYRQTQSYYDPYQQRAYQQPVYQQYYRPMVNTNAYSNYQPFRASPVLPPQRAQPQVNMGRPVQPLLPDPPRPANTGAIPKWTDTTNQQPSHDRYEDSQSHSQSSRDIIEQKPPIVPVKIRQRLCEVLTSYPNGILGSNIKTAYSRLYMENLDPTAFGFETVVAMLSTLGDVIKLEQVPSGGFKVHLKPISPKIGGGKSRLEEQSKSSSQKPITRSYYSDGCTFSPDLMRDIQEVLLKFPHGLRSSYFAENFKKHTGKELPVRELGYTSVIDLMASMPEQVTIERPNEKDWVLFDGKSYKRKPVVKAEPAKPREREPPKSTAPSVNDATKETIRQVLKVYKGGIEYHKFLDCFKYCTGKDLSVVEVGFASLENLFLSLSDIVKIDYSKKGDVVLIGLGEPVDPNDCLLKRIPGLREQDESRRPSGRIPPDAIGPGVYYNLPKIPEENEFFMVTVSHIDSPGHFWFQLVPNMPALEHLMDELEYCYCGSESDLYVMPDDMYTIGQICVAIFAEDQNWHRVTISAIKNLDYVECFFVDYGTVSSVHRQNVRLLRSKFLKFPAQAIRAKLYGLIPANGKSWSVQSRDRMLELMIDKSVVGIIPTEPQNGVVSICLTDTSGEEDLHLNDVLLSENHAIADIPDDNNMAMEDSTAALEDLEGITDAEDLRIMTEKKEEERRVKEALEMGIQPQYVMCVAVLDEQVHIIKYQNRPFMIGHQIASLLGKEESLRSLSNDLDMLRKQKSKFNFELLTKEKDPEIFDTFDQYVVPGTLDYKGDLKDHVTVYPLESVVDIMRLVGNPSKDLVAEIRAQLEQFDPNDPYWLGEEDNESEELSVDSEWNIPDFEEALQTLQLRRKRILQAMASNDADLQKNFSVDELELIEQKVAEFKTMISKKKGQSSGGSGDDELIQSCIAQQYSSKSAKGTESNDPSRGNMANSKVQVVQPMPSTTMPGVTVDPSSDKVGQATAEQLNAMGAAAANTLGGTTGLNPPGGVTSQAGMVPGGVPGAPGLVPNLANMNAMGGLGNLGTQPDLAKMMQEMNMGGGVGNNMMQVKLYMDLINMLGGAGQQTMPQQTMPQQTMPQQTMPQQTMPQQSMFNMAQPNMAAQPNLAQQMMNQALLQNPQLLQNQQLLQQQLLQQQLLNPNLQQQQLLNPNLQFPNLNTPNPQLYQQQFQASNLNTLNPQLSMNNLAANQGMLSGLNVTAPMATQLNQSVMSSTMPISSNQSQSSGSTTSSGLGGGQQPRGRGRGFFAKK